MFESCKFFSPQDKKEAAPNITFGAAIGIGNRLTVNL
jgi:hypothetical protein